jgi:hypothetical protein
MPTPFLRGERRGTENQRERIVAEGSAGVLATIKDSATNLAPEPKARRQCCLQTPARCCIGAYPSSILTFG